mgnify:CR=1 FL=1
MQESTTPFGCARWMMSLSDDKTYGKSSTLYTANGLAWIAVFFATRIATIPFLLRFGWQDARMLARSATRCPVIGERRPCAAILPAILPGGAARRLRQRGEHCRLLLGLPRRIRRCNHLCILPQKPHTIILSIGNPDIAGHADSETFWSIEARLGTWAVDEAPCAGIAAGEGAANTRVDRKPSDIIVCGIADRERAVW